MNKKTLQFVAPVRSMSGYGKRSRDLISAVIDSYRFDEVLVRDLPWRGTTRLKKEDLGLISDHLVAEPRKNMDFYVQISMVNQFIPYGDGVNVGISAGTEAKEPTQKEAIHLRSSMDAIAFSSEVVAQKYRDKGVKNAGVVIEAIDHDTFTGKLSNRYDGKFDESNLFLTAGTWEAKKLNEGRKAISDTIDAFCRSFSEEDDVALVVKTSGGNYSHMDFVECADTIKAIKSMNDNPPPIYLLHGYISDEEMAALYSHPKMRFFMTLTRGEGFGRHIAEALSSGLPVIVPDHGGYMDYVDDSQILIEGQWQRVPEIVSRLNPGFENESEWYVSSPDRSTLRTALRQSQKYLAATKDLTKNIRETYTKERMVEQFIDLLHTAEENA